MDLSSYLQAKTQKSPKKPTYEEPEEEPEYWQEQRESAYKLARFQSFDETPLRKDASVASLLKRFHDHSSATLKEQPRESKPEPKESPVEPEKPDFKEQMAALLQVQKKTESLQDQFERQHRELLQSVHVPETKEQKIETWDRPTKMLLMGINDKVIQMQKHQEHDQEKIAKRLERMDDKLKRQSDVFTRLEKIEHLLQAFEKPLQRQHSTSSFETSSESESELLLKLEQIQKSLADQFDAFNKEHGVNQDRLRQFLSMLEILQDAHTRLANKSPELDDLKPKMDKIDSIHHTLISYLPLNLESKLDAIESKLGRINGTVPASDTQLLKKWQQDIMSRHASVHQSIDEVQCTLNKILETVKPAISRSNDWVQELKELLVPAREVQDLRKQVQQLTKENHDLQLRLAQHKDKSVLDLVSRPLLRSNSNLTNDQ
ncbi:hypothetical protein EDD86DRAFT_249871 [Gorgonomyces haynaldii]|nr:hypothetical protein EDD86DRAFT_249871 [Gorgonomyces haynaldii]